MSRSLWLKVILILALVLRLAAIPVGLREVRARGLDAYDEYGGIAKNIVEGRGFSYNWYTDVHPTSIHAPVYAYMLAGLFSVFGQGGGGAIAVILLNIALSILFLYLIFRSAEGLFGSLAGYISVAIFAFYPVQIYYSTSVLPTILYEAMLFLCILLAWKLRQELTLRWGLIWGLSLGLTALSYSFIMMLAPLLALWVLISAGRARLRESISSVALAAFVAILICVPWTIRNYHVQHRWIPIRDMAGTNVWWGNGPLAAGGDVMMRGSDLHQYPEDIERALRSIPNEVDQDRYLMARATQYMKEHPKRTAHLVLLKTRNFWWFYEGQGASASRMERIMPLIKISKALLLIFSAIGALLIWRKDRSLVILGLAACLAITFVFVSTVIGRIRYFAPLEPILAIAAGYAIARIIERFLPKKILGSGDGHADGTSAGR